MLSRFIMLAHMKKHHISVRGNVLHVVYDEVIYDIPKSIAEKYKVSATDEGDREPSEGAVSADALFAELDRKYTKPGALLRGLRARENLSQIEFAQAIGVTQSDLSKMELGKRPIGKIIAKRIAEKFDIDYRSLLA